MTDQPHSPEDDAPEDDAHPQRVATDTHDFAPYIRILGRGPGRSSPGVTPGARPMARAHACSLLATVAVLMLVGGCTAPASAQNRTDTASAVAPPATPMVKAVAPPAVPIAAPISATAPSRLWPFKRLYNVDYVDVQDIAGRYGLKATWVTSGRVMQLVDEHGHARLKFEDRKRDFYLEGVRVFMGEATVFNKGIGILLLMA